MEVEITKTFEKVYKDESDSIFRFCIVRVSSREEALDITAETFLRLWRSMNEGKDILNKKAFLFTIAHRLIIDWYRKKKSLSLDKIISIEGESDWGTLDKVAIEDIDIAAEGRYLVDKINELSPSYRYPVYLRYVEDLSPREISEILGISINATSVRINRGVEELRKKTKYDEL